MTGLLPALRGFEVRATCGVPHPSTISLTIMERAYEDYGRDPVNIAVERSEDSGLSKNSRTPALHSPRQPRIRIPAPP